VGWARTLGSVRLVRKFLVVVAPELAITAQSIALFSKRRKLRVSVQFADMHEKHTNHTQEKNAQ